MVRQAGRRRTPGARALVVAEHPAAAQAGADVLRRGGNAVDAAVTAAFVMGVVEPWGSGIGGGGLALIHRARERNTAVVDFAMDAPVTADAAMFSLGHGQGPSRFGWRKVEGDQNIHGYRAAGVPGLVAGLAAMLNRFGTIALDTAVGPAIDLAEHGCDVSSQTSLRALVAIDLIRQFPATAQILLGRGLPLSPGDAHTTADQLIQTDLALTLRRIADEGPDGFYAGDLAATVAADMAANGGLLREDDLGRYRATVSNDAQLTTYRGCTIAGVPGACGCVTVQQSLNILEAIDAPGSELEAVHARAEAFRMAFADRYAYIGDPARGRVPTQGLLSKRYSQRLAERIVLNRAMPVVLPGDPWEFNGGTVGRRPDRGHRAPAQEERSTTHLCTADADGNAVTLTATLGNSFGCGVTIPGTGIILNNAMLWFNPEPGHPNSIAPGKRGLNNMSPLLISKDDRPLLTLGGSGGARILNCLSQVAMNMLDQDMGLLEAIDAPRIDCSGPTVLIDSRHPLAVIEGLAAFGHNVRAVSDSVGVNHLARVFAIAMREDGLLCGGADRAGMWAARGC